MPNRQSPGNYNPQRRKQQKNNNESESPLSSLLTFRFAFLLLFISWLLPRFSDFIFQEVRWTFDLGKYPPFSFMSQPPEDFYLTGEQVIRKHGYNLETHWVTTEDGYINHMFRVNKFSQEKLLNNRTKPAVLLHHGHLDSCDIFLMNGEKSITFILAEAGYDVYLMNARGNKYSMGHVKYDSMKEYAYWENSIPDYQAQYDTPAFLERIKEVSRVEKVTVIAHSMGCRVPLFGLE